MCFEAVAAAIADVATAAAASTLAQARVAAVQRDTLEAQTRRSLRRGGEDGGSRQEEGERS